MTDATDRRPLAAWRRRARSLIRSADGRERPAVVNGLHLTVLWGFAVLQPTLSFLSENMEFFTRRTVDGGWFVLIFVALAVAPPGILLGVEALAGLVSARLRQVLHLVFCWALLVLFSLYALRQATPYEGAVVTLVSIALGLAAVLLYARARPVRSLLTALTPAPAIFLLFFLFFTPARGLAFPPDMGAAELPPSETPVVVVVFDELPISSLMTADGEIDSARFPHFGELASRSTWFRNVVSNSDHTTQAVPTLLSGQRPDPALAPIPSGHPENLFTLLGASHELHAMESAAWLCPTSLCAQDAPKARRAASLASAVSLASVVTLGLEDLVGIRYGRKPRTWSEALADRGPNRRVDPQSASPVELEEHPDAQFQRFLDLIQPYPEGERPPLYFLHSNLPHTPWRFLPSGKSYKSAVVTAGRWPNEPGMVSHAFQRHLLQTAFADRLLGRLTRRLRETALYDQSLLVVVADHGISFKPGEPRRKVSQSNAADIGMVPLFIKAPGQEEGRTVARAGQTVDVVPTIADGLDLEMPWSTDGGSLLEDRGGDGEPTLTIGRDGEETVEIDLRKLERQRDATVRQRDSLFGRGGGRWDLFGIGPHRELLGERVADVPTGPDTGATAELRAARDLKSVDPDSPYVPALVRGRLRGTAPGASTDVAVAVNGRVAGIGRSFRQEGETQFYVMVAPQALRPGRNSVQVFEVSGRLGDPALVPLSGG